AKGHFFAVDARAWAKVCESGAMNEFVAYLVQARGTARDNRTSTWSVEAIERHTGISRHKAAAALKNLRTKGFEQLRRGGTKPLYDLILFSEMPGADPRPVLNGAEQNILYRVQGGLGLNRNQRTHARSAANGPPPPKWSTVSYGFALKEDPQCRGRVTSRKRSSPSCGR